MQQTIGAVAAHAAQCGVQEWQRIRKARRAINDLLATIEGRERTAAFVTPARLPSLAGWRSGRGRF
jgi:hypothetical protein